MKKGCTHPAICAGICLVCHERVDGGTDRAEQADVEKPVDAQTTPADGQETAKKATRKRKA